MTKAILAALFLLLATVLPAAAEGPYAGVGAAMASNHDADYDGPGGGEVEYEWGFAVNGSIGIPFDPFRLELQYTFSQADTDDERAEYNVMSLMLNGYYDFTMPSAPVSPFVGAGIGYIYGDVQGRILGMGDRIDDHDTALGYQLTAGVTRKINDYLDLDLYYRFQSSFSDFELGELEAEYQASMIFASLRYRIW
jgi:opacity protein-like surface antigen